MKLKYILPILAALTLSACSDKDSWQPGPLDPAGSQMAFFAARDSYDLIIEPEMQGLVNVTISRGHTQEAVTLPIEVTEAPEGVIVPASVSFAAGEKNQSLTINAEAMPMLTSGTLSLTIPTEYTSPYGAGTPTLTLRLIRAGQWLELGDDMTLTFSRSVNGNRSLPDQHILWLEGTNKFTIKNFLDSGLDVNFDAVNPQNKGTVYDINFTSNMILEDDPRVIEDTGFDATYSAGYYLWDDALNDWPEDWSIGGTTPLAYDFYCYNGDWGSSGDFTPWVQFTKPDSGKLSQLVFSGLITWANEREHYINFSYVWTPKFEVVIP